MITKKNFTNRFLSWGKIGSEMEFNSEKKSNKQELNHLNLPNVFYHGEDIKNIQLVFSID